MNDIIFTKLKELNSRNIKMDNQKSGINILWVRFNANADDRCRVNLKMHKHTFFELHLLLDGSIGYSSENGDLVSVKKGEYLLISPDICHMLSGESDSFKKLSVAFSYTDSETEKFTFRNGLFCGDASAWIQNIVDSLYIAMIQTNGTDKLMIKNIISSLILLICDNVICERKHVPEETDERINTAKRFIEDNSDRAISIP